jgi:hypothetical protein
MPDIDLPFALELLATREDIRAEGKRLREHMTICMERVRRDIHALIDAIEFLKHLDS